MSAVTRRGFLAGGLGIAAAVSLAACAGGATGSGGSGGSGGGSKPIKVGYIADYNGAALLAVADDQGYWAKAGLKPEFVPFTNGPLAIQALGTNNVDVAYIGSGALWLPASGKAEIWAINTVSNADRIIAQPGITSLAALKGKKVGVPEGTSGDQLLGLALEKAGMTRQDIEVVPMDPSTAVSAFASRQIDGAALWYPLIDNIKKRTPDLVELVANKDYFAELTFPSSFVAAPGRAEKDAALAAGFVSVIKAANDFRKADQDATLTSAASFLKVGKDTLQPQVDVATSYTSAELEQKTTDGTVGRWLTGLQKQFVAGGKLTSVADPTTFYTADLYVKTTKA